MCRKARVVGVGKGRDPLARRVAIAAMKAPHASEGAQNAKLLQVPDLSTGMSYPHSDFMKNDPRGKLAQNTEHTNKVCLFC